MAKIVEATFLKMIFLQKNFKMLGHKIRANQFSDRVHIDVIKITITITASAYRSVDFLLFLYLDQYPLKWRNKRKGSTTGFGFRCVLLDDFCFAILFNFYYCMPD